MEHTNIENIKHSKHTTYTQSECMSCVSLRKEIQELKARVAQLENQTLISNGTRIFRKDEFFKNKTVDYLRSCGLDIDYHAREKLFNRINKLDFACVKYLMDLYAHPDSKLNWYEKFFDKEYNCRKNTLQFVTKCGSADAVKYILDLWYTRDVSMLDCYCSDGSKIKLIKSIVGAFDEERYGSIVVYALEMWARENFDLECVGRDNWRLIHEICDYCSMNEICCIFDIYERKNLDIECKSHRGNTPCSILKSRGGNWYKYVMERETNIYEPLG